VELHWIDLTLVVAYLVAVAAVGMWFSRGMKTGKDLFLGGRSLPWWAVGTSLVVTDIGAKDMMGLADNGYRYGLTMANFDFIGCILPVLIAAFVVMPYLWMAGVYTIPEYLGRRYSSTVRTFFAIIWGLFMVGVVAVVFAAAGTMFEALLGWDFWFSVAMTGALVGVYVIFGGLKAVVITDFLSCIVLIVGASLICIVGVYDAGGFAGLQEKLAQVPGTEHHLQLIIPADSGTEYAWPGVLLGLGFVLGPAYWMGNQAIVQRAFGTRSQNEARAAYVLCAAIKLIFPLLLVLPGLIGLALFRDEIGPFDDESWVGGRVLPTVIHLLPRGVLGIVFGAFLAGVLSNLDSYVNSAATLWITDLYKPWVDRDATDHHCMILGRWLTAGFLAGGAIASDFMRENFGSVFDAYQTMLSQFQGPLFALLLLGMLTKRATASGAVSGMLAGVATSVVMTFGDRL
jgi:SSS family solute:Na+ symporter